MEISVLLTTIGAIALFGFQPVQCVQCGITFREKAYTGPYEIDFPRDCKSEPPSQSCWMIKAYRKGYIVQLNFHNVNITEDEVTHACRENIVVHDGKDSYGTVLASFCGLRNPEIKTSSRHAFIVFSGNGTDSQRAKFKIKYRAIKRRLDESDHFALSLAFGGSIGAIALIISCSGIVRRYKQAQRGHGTFLWFGRSRVNNGTGSSNGTSARNEQQNRVGQTTGASGPDQLSIRQRITIYVQNILKMKSNQETNDASERSMSTTASSASAHQRRRSRDRPANRSSGPHRQHSNASTSNRYPDFSLSSCSQDGTDSSAFHVGHEAFGYQDIPVSSFTSDPDAVRPPTYEDSINRVNPLYVHRYGSGVHYNQAFEMKEEDAYMFSPPPPYTELNHLEQPASSRPSSPVQEVIMEPVEILQPPVDQSGKPS